MEITEFERRRADNLIWNGAQDYTLETSFRVFDDDGCAELYWNSIVGAVCHRFDREALHEYYKTFAGQPRQTMYESLFWIALEDAAFQLEREQRPVLPSLRAEYARRTLRTLDPEAQLEDMDKYRLALLLRGHLRHAIDRDDGIPAVQDRKLLSVLESEPEADTAAMIARIDKALRSYCGLGDEKKDADRPAPDFFARLGRLFRFHLIAPDPAAPVRRLAFGFGEHSDEYAPVYTTRDHMGGAWTRYATQSEGGTREFIHRNFGAPLYDESRLRQLEAQCCTGNHTWAHLYFTRGEYPKELISHAVSARIQQTALEQRKYNLRSYHANETRYALMINRLAERIRSSMLVCLDSQTVRADNGMLDAGRVWRMQLLEDQRIFTRERRGDNGNLTVDLLLDASHSQTDRQAMVAAQGFMIAESLTRCNIPCRAHSFCSIDGYTVLQLLRDYNETDRNQDIFRYFSAGANRDGLAVRTLMTLMRDNTAEHRLLIVLTDCKPNDPLESPMSNGAVTTYHDAFGVRDTAAEVHRARLEGMQVISVFTGDDEDLPSAQRIYGRQMVRIRSLDSFADTVGRLLQTCLQGI